MVSNAINVVTAIDKVRKITNIICKSHKKKRVEKTLIGHNIINYLSKAEYAALALIVSALKPIRLGSEKLCNEI